MKGENIMDNHADDCVAVIECSHYHATDWHDWSSWITYLERGGPLVKPEDAEGFIIEDFLGIIREAGITAKTDDVKAGIHSHSAKFVVNGCPDGHGPAFELSFAGNGKFKFTACQAATWTIDYTVKELNRNDVRYLAAREFLEASRLSPLSMRTDYAYTDDYDRAKRDLAAMEKKPEGQIRPFLSERHVILIGSEQEFADSEWYRNEQAANHLRERDPGLFEKTYGPSTAAHLQRLQAAYAGT